MTRESDPLGELTVVIPTRNRPTYLERLLDYIQSIDLPATVVVADSSDPESCIAEDRIPDGLLYRSDFEPDIPPSEKIRLVLETVSTDYAVLCADDDFITPSGLRAAVQYLESHPGYSCAHGHFIGFSTASTDRNDFTWTPAYTHSITIPHERPAHRVVAHFENYVPTFYSVHRTDSLQRAFQYTVSATSDVRFGELLPSMTAIIDGRFKHLNIFYAARDNADQLGATADSIIDYINDGRFSEKYEPFRRRLATHLAQSSTAPESEAAGVIDEAMIAYLRSSLGLSAESATRVVRRPNLDYSLDGRGAASRSLLSMFKTQLTQAMYHRLLVPDRVSQKLFYATLGTPGLRSSRELARIKHAVLAHPATQSSS